MILTDCVPTGLVDFPTAIDPHGPVIMSGVEPELVEEINAAYADMMEELGKCS